MAKMIKRNPLLRESPFNIFGFLSRKLTQPKLSVLLLSHYGFKDNCRASGIFFLVVSALSKGKG